MDVPECTLPRMSDGLFTSADTREDGPYWATPLGTSVTGQGPCRRRCRPECKDLDGCLWRRTRWVAARSSSWERALRWWPRFWRGHRTSSGWLDKPASMRTIDGHSASMHATNDQLDSMRATSWNGQGALCVQFRHAWQCTWPKHAFDHLQGEYT